MTQLERRPPANEGPLVFALHGDIDVQTAEGIRGAAALARSSGYRSLTFDFSDVTFIDSQGINALFAVHRSLPAGGVLRIRRPTHAVRFVLHLVGVDTVIDIDD